MKKIISITLAALIVLSAPGCKKFVSKDDISPNDPTIASLPTLLPVVEVAVFATYTGQLSRTSSIFIQHSQGTDQQMVDYAKYKITENAVQNDWTTIYNAGVANAKILITQSTDEKSPYYTGMGKVCLAMLYGIATDFWGDIPTEEAGRGKEFLKPAYVTQETAIAQIQTLLDDAIVHLQTSAAANNKIPGAEDYIFGGNPAQWIKTAWILKARYANRLSKKNASGSATTALGFIDNAIAAGLAGNVDDANAQFFDASGNELNQWYAFNQERGNYIKMNATLIDSLRTKGDPRLAIYATLDDTAGYSGTGNGDNATTSTSNMGAYFASAGSPLPLVTYTEAKFIEAEAALRSGNSARAQTAYGEALGDAIYRYVGIVDTIATAYITANGTLTGTNQQMLEKIMYEKWVSSITQPEAWADWRRTGLPALTPASNGVVPSIPRRYPTEQNERLYNPNAKVVSNSTDKVWWDQ